MNTGCYYQSTGSLTAKITAVFQLAVRQIYKWNRRRDTYFVSASLYTVFGDDIVLFRMSLSSSSTRNQPLRFGRWDYLLVHVQTVRNSPKSSHDFLVIPSVILRLNKRLGCQRPPNQYFVQFTGCDARTIGLTVSASDSKHRGFDPFRSIRNNIGQVVHTVPLSPSRINRYQSRGGEASRLGR